MASRLPPRGPGLVRGDSKRGSFRVRANSRELGLGLGRANSREYTQTDNLEYDGPTRMTSDARLLMASLDTEAVEDEAEATLLDILERRNNPFPNIGGLGGLAPSISPQKHIAFRDEESSPRSSPMHKRTLSDIKPTPPRPGLPSRGIARGRSERFLIQQRPLLVGKNRSVSDSSQSSGPSGLTTAAERARLVALTMKAEAASEMENPSITQNVIGEGELPDLMQALEAQRETGSTSSQRKSRGSGDRSRSRRYGGMTGSISTHSIENQSRGGGSSFSGGFRASRPFSGVSSTPFANDGYTSNVEQMFQFAEHLQEVILEQIDEVGEEEEEVAGLGEPIASQVEGLPANVEMPDDGDIAVVPNEQTPILEKQGVSRRKFDSAWPVASPVVGSRFYKLRLWWAGLKKHAQMLAVAFDMPFVKGRLWSFMQNEVTIFIVPALALSAFFFYQLNNPIMVALPTDASISWWILFVLRHYVTLQLAYVFEYLFVDVLALRSLISVQVIGPLATLYTINAKGWPFILTAWGLLNFLLIQEGHESSLSSHAFFNHWFSFTEIEMFTDENPSGGVVQSDRYREVLFSMIVAGVATSLKRTVLALYLGKRIYIHYKPRLEKVMEQMILLTEVADLGEAIDDFEFEKVDHDFNADKDDPKKASATRTSTRTSMMLTDNIRSSTMNAVVQKKIDESAESDSEQDESWSHGKAGGRSSGDKGGAKSPSQEVTGKGEGELEKEDSQHDIKRDDKRDADTQHDASNKEGDIPLDLPAISDDEPPIPVINEPVQDLLRDTSTTAHIKSLLDRWQEPVNKADKVTDSDPTIHEILQFRKALSFLDDVHPFGSAFGPAFTRDTCIKSSKNLYKRLLALSPGSPVLNFDIIGVLAYNIDGTFDDKKAKSLVKLFRPDKFDEVSMLAFIQSCDYVYKKLRYLRASVGNSTSIDSVLEEIFNSLYGFFLLLIVLSILQLNPWTLLVSMSTVLVSFAFAFGSSVAKIIEGVIMIAVRRPFDLGDRISIVDTNTTSNPTVPGYNDTWFVEDCNLFTTTLRMGRTNEVSTVNNGSIANAKIINHGRSVNAIMDITMRINLAATSEQIDILKAAIEQYISDNPRVWSSMIMLLVTQVDPANDLIVYQAVVQHVRTWQDMLPILKARGEMTKFCNEILVKLGIHYPCTVRTNEVFIKEMPGQGMLPVGEAPLPNVAIPRMPADDFQDGDACD